MNKTTDFTTTDVDLSVVQHSSPFKVKDGEYLTFAVFSPDNANTSEIRLEYSSTGEEGSFVPTEHLIVGDGIIPEISIKSVNYVRWALVKETTGLCTVTLTKSYWSKFC